MAAPKGNQYARGNPSGKAGRKPKHESPTWMVRQFNQYFKKQDENGKPYTITGLARSIELTRKQLIEYSNRDDFRNVINAGKSRIEEQFEELLVNGKNAAGTIFWLKNQGWYDTQQIDINDVSELTKDQLINKLQQLSTAGIGKKAV